MQILIISDSHGHIANLKLVMGFAKKYKVSAVIHAGDWNNVESVEVVTSFGIPLYTVLGNADVRNDVIQKLKLESQKFGEQYLIIELGERKIGITHKMWDNRKYFTGKKLDLIVNGHWHFKNESTFEGIKMIRPGGIISGINFTVYDTDTNKVEFIEDNS